LSLCVLHLRPKVTVHSPSLAVFQLRPSFHRLALTELSISTAERGPPIPATISLISGLDPPVSGTGCDLPNFWFFELFSD